MQGRVAGIFNVFAFVLKCCAFFNLALNFGVLGAEFLVTTEKDAGAGSLRAAIQAANLSAGQDVIRFQIPGTPPFTIQLASPLPIISDPVRIEAPTGALDTPRTIELNGSGAGQDGNGLHIAVGNCVIRGLAIGGFGAHGILLDFFGQNTIQGNYLGTDALGFPRPNSQTGIALYASNNNRVGGTNIADGNFISGNGTGIYITGAGAFGNIVAGNLIGPTLSGTEPLGNNQNGVLIYNAERNVIGGTAPGSRNVISANAQSGVYIFGSDSISNVVAGNFIGTDSSGTRSLANGFDGVTIFNASSNLVGGTAPGAANVISGNRQRGVNITGNAASANVVEANFIGVDRSGTNEMGNGFSGVTIGGVSGNRIGGTTASGRNVISANRQSGILLRGSGTEENVIIGNYIGTDASGLVSLRNYYNGITLLENASSNTIGGSVEGADNLISGNSEAGVFIAEESTANLLEGNRIGLDSTGTHSLSNGYAGVRLEYGGNCVGRPGGKANVISGNGHAGVEIFGDLSSSNRVQGNLIGTDTEAKFGLGNSGGVAILGGMANLVGGTNQGAGNVISGNDDSGVFLVDPETSQNVIQGNLIGTDPSGKTAIPNNGDGISIFGAADNTIGGTTAFAGNIISANLQDGIMIRGDTASNNVVQRNFIGTQVDGVSPLGNRLHGVEITEESSNNLIGGSAAGSNRIAFSQTADFDGVRVHSGTGNTIRCNAIFSNPGLAIDLGEAGVTGNDSLDIDAGANQSMNFPTLRRAVVETNTVTLSGEFSGRPDEVITIDLYFNPTANQTGFGDATVWLGAVEKLADPKGTAFLEFRTPSAGYERGFVSATATDRSGNTSELSRSVRINKPDRDSDGLPDSYESTHGLNPDNPADATADPDRDGLTNLQEYYAGTNPFDGKSTLRLNAYVANPGALLSFETFPGKHYRIEFAEAVHTLWRSLSEFDGNGARITYTDSNANGLSRFYRLVLVP